MSTNRRTRFEANMDKRNAMDKAEKEGRVADSAEVRTELMMRVHRGEITLEQAQAELKRIKREGKKSGLLTRSQAFDQG